MSDSIDYKNNPLHGLSLKNLLIELVDYYGFEILFAYLNINCFKTQPSIESSVKFLKKTDWAREKVEAFYLYQFKNLPRASEAQFKLPPRDRIVPENQAPGEPAELSLEDAERLRQKRTKKAANHSSGPKPYPSRATHSQTSRRGDTRAKYNPEAKAQSRPLDTELPQVAESTDPWANWKNKS